MTPLAKYLSDYDIHLNIGMLWIAHNDKQPIYDIASEEWIIEASMEEVLELDTKELASAEMK